MKKKAYKNYGLDLLRGKVVDEVKAGVLEPSMSKVKSLKSAVEACISIMRIDTMIKLDREWLDTPYTNSTPRLIWFAWQLSNPLRILTEGCNALLPPRMGWMEWWGN